jgi:putative ABC transport system permease protein
LSQLKYIQQKNLGFAKEQRIVIPLRTQQARAAYEALRNDITTQPDIVSVAGTSNSPGGFYFFDGNFIPEGKRQDEATNCKVNLIEPGLIETMQYELLAGRTFSQNRYEADKEKTVIINEAAAQHMGWKPEEALGKKITSEWGGNLNLEVIGILKNFNYESLYNEIRPMVFVAHDPSWYSFAIVHAKPGNWKSLLASLEQSWAKYNASLPFEYTFLNDQVNKQYEADKRLSEIITYLTSIAIFISCLGLYGLAAFTAEQRTKEIGVRKVLGASVSNITALLSKDFLKLVLIGNIIAWPVAHYGMSRWLEDFAYRIDISPWIFVLAGSAALLIAILTVSFQSIKAALANPVKSLRSE